MCWDTSNQWNQCCCDHWNHKCHCHEHEGFDYNWYREWDIVWEVDFQIVDKDELEEMKDSWKVWWNLADDLVKMWFIDENDDLYEEMKNEKRNWVMYDI